MGQWHIQHFYRITSYNVCYTKLLRYGLAKYDKKANGVTPIPQPVLKPSKTIAVGSKVKVKQGARDMNTHGTLASFVYAGIYLVRSVSGQRVVIAPTMTGAVTAAINIKDLEVL